MEQFNLLYTCDNQLCKALYCCVCIKQWLATDSCPKVCATCKSSTVLMVAHKTTSVPAYAAINLTAVENSTLNYVEGFTVPDRDIFCQPTSHPKVITVQFVMHFLLHLVFICHLRTKHTTMLVIYYVFLVLHLLWLVSIRTHYCQQRYRLAMLTMAAPIRTQYCKRRYILTVLATAAPAALMLYRLGIVAAILPVFDVPVISVISTLACIIDIATCWPF
jgi:hypothetical protein